MSRYGAFGIDYRRLASLGVIACLLCALCHVPAASAQDTLSQEFMMDEGIPDEDEEVDPDDQPFDRTNLVGAIWYYQTEEGETVGPRYFEDLKSRFFEGELSLVSKVWRTEWPDWQNFRDIPGVRDHLQETASIKEKLLLAAMDERKFVEQLMSIQEHGEFPNADTDLQMVCARKSAVSYTLWKGLSRRVLQEIGADISLAREERVKLQRVIPALQYRKKSLAVKLSKELETVRKDSKKIEAVYSALHSKIKSGIANPNAAIDWKEWVMTEFSMVKAYSKVDPSIAYEMLIVTAVFVVVVLVTLYLTFAATALLFSPVPKAAAAPSKKPEKKGSSGSKGKSQSGAKEASA